MKTAAPSLLAWLLFLSLAPLAKSAEPDPMTLARKAREVLTANCYRCHGQNGTNEGGFNYILDRERLLNRRKIVPGEAAKSRIYKRVTSEDNPMPPEEEKTRPSTQDIALLKQWIEAGAPDIQVQTARRPFLSPGDMVQMIHDDLNKVNERDRRFARYFTLVHLYNAGLSDDELHSYRHGLAKLANSLSWGSRVVVPQPIDPAKTILRIDLRDYQWNEQVWDAILGVNPYGTSLATEAAKFCVEATRCPLPYVRADWFVAAASRPPLYHDVLQLPRTDRELEKLLRVDVAENIRQERVARAGFNSSGVSRNNRLIERHESGAVVYWKSYDFGGNTEKQNLFANPLGPGDGVSCFQHDGGEIIFNLPNGLQGYMLVDRQGRRIDKGPTAIVSDPKRPDRAVENGISCMSCHAKGIIEKSDQVRSHVLKNARGFAKADVETILALYPAQEQFTALLREDARRFQQAVAKTGAPLSATEPIVSLALRFEAELDLPLAAAEAGVRPEELLKTLDRSAFLAQRLGALKIEGGTLQRQVFVNAFPDLVRELRVGEFLHPKKAAFARLLEQGDALQEKGDLAGAIRAYTEALGIDPDHPATALAYIGRGDVKREKGELEQAVADYEQALRLDPSSAVGHNNLGLTYKRKGDPERAVKHFNEALRLDPRFAVAYHNLGATLHGQGEYEKAIEAYTRALEIDARSAVVYNNRGYTHYENRDFDRAIADFSEALRLDSNFAIAYNNRGLAHNRKESYDRAIADFSAAVRLDPKFAKAYYNRSIAYEKKGDGKRAEADRRQAIRLDPGLDDK